jgi:hypothetical protein
MAPVTQGRGVCCMSTVVSSPVPQNHYAFPSSTGSTDSRDPRGWLYVVTTLNIGYTGAQNLSSLLAPATINSILNYCSVKYPPGESGNCESSSAAELVTAINLAGGKLSIKPVSQVASETDVLRRITHYDGPRHRSNLIYCG